MERNEKCSPVARAVLTALALACLLNAGCLLAAAGAACGAAVGYAYYEGKLSHSFHATCEDTTAAVRTALAELGMPIVKEEFKAGETVILSRTGDGEKVRIYLSAEATKFPALGPFTLVSVRVATFGDPHVSTRIMDQIAAHLVSDPPPPSAAPNLQLAPPQSLSESPPPRPLAPQSSNPPPIPQTAPPPLAK